MHNWSNKKPAGYIVEEFNYFIHGSTSQTLELMKQTGFKLQSPIDMIENYGLAPLAGEIYQGGFRRAASRGNPSFGRVEHHRYDIKRVINGYAVVATEPLSQETVRQQLIGSLSEGPELLYRNINIILIEATRYQQLGGDLTTIPLMNNLTKKLSQSIQLWYVYRFLAHYIERDTQALGLQQIRDLQDAFYTHFRTPNDWYTKISALELDVKKLFKSHSNADIQSINDLLTLPKTSEILSRTHSISTVITLPVTSPFTIKKNTTTSSNQTQNGKGGYDICQKATPFHTLLAYLISGYYGQSEMLIIDDLVKKELKR